MSVQVNSAIPFTDVVVVVTTTLSLPNSYESENTLRNLVVIPVVICITSFEQNTTYNEFEMYFKWRIKKPFQLIAIVNNYSN